MNIFKSVKGAVSVMDAASFYGIKVNRSGLCNCLFHNDKTPSMKVDIRYYCFGCGATGDVIDFVGKLFGLSPLDAAKKIAMDFNISTTDLNNPSINKRSTPVNTDNNIIQRNNEYQLIRTFDAYVLDVLFSLHQYKEKLMAFKRDFAPASIDELDTCNPLFAGKIKYNEFSDKVDICGDFPWKRYSVTYCDNDLRHIILYLESEYGLKKDGDIATAINIAA